MTLYLRQVAWKSYLSSGSDAVFWVVSNEPHLKFEGLQPPEVTNTLTGLVHYSHAEIRQIELLYTVEQGAIRLE